MQWSWSFWWCGAKIESSNFYPKCISSIYFKWKPISKFKNIGSFLGVKAESFKAGVVTGSFSYSLVQAGPPADPLLLFCAAVALQVSIGLSPPH